MKKIDIVANETENEQKIEILAQPLNRPYVIQKDKIEEIFDNTDSLVNRENTIKNSGIF